MLIPIKKEDAFSKSLPKWPQMLVIGKSVPESLAKEIIFATDITLTDLSGYAGGNDRAWISRFRDNASYNIFDFENRSEQSCAIEENVIKRAKFLYTEYVRNDWAASAYVFGPHGWCKPNGYVHFEENIGKWPSVEEVAQDWSQIAKRWPVLDLYVTLMDGECSDEDTSPVVTFHVFEGKVEFFKGSLEKHDELGHRFGHKPASCLNLLDPRREHGLPVGWIEEFTRMAKGWVNQAIKDVQQETIAS